MQGQSGTANQGPLCCPQGPGQLLPACRYCRAVLAKKIKMVLFPEDLILVQQILYNARSPVLGRGQTLLTRHGKPETLIWCWKRCPYKPPFHSTGLIYHFLLHCREMVQLTPLNVCTGRKSCTLPYRAVPSPALLRRHGLREVGEKNDKKTPLFCGFGVCF